MKKTILIIVLGLFISVNIMGQTMDVSKTAEDTVVVETSELHPNLDITIGYASRTEINAIKTSVSANNILLKRVGIYVSLEKGLDSDYFSNTYGITTTVNKYIYLWAGMGWISKNEIFNHFAWSMIRKEFGIGITPYKSTVLRLGWSIGVGPTISAGIKIPI